MAISHRHASLFVAAFILAACGDASPPPSEAVAVESTPAPAEPAPMPEVPPEPRTPPSFVAREVAGLCNIEALRMDGSTGELVVAGWRFLAGPDGGPAASWLRITPIDVGPPVDVPIVDARPRPDVADYLGRAEATGAGFRLAGLRVPQAGAYAATVLFDTGDGWLSCAHVRRLELP